MPKIAIYAGHGGSDPGAVGNGLLEKNVNLAVSNAASAILRGWGYTVINNRTTDVNRDINRDAAMANSNQVDALVEIHQNSNEGRPGSGSEAFYSIKDTGRGRAIAEAILARLAALGFQNRGAKTHTNSAGQDTFGILRLTSGPSVLVETAFINNPDDMARFDANQVGRAIADGIRQIIPIGGGSSSYPGHALRLGSSGAAVQQIQRCINNINSRNQSASRLAEDGSFGPATQSAVIAFQRAYGLSPDGVVGKITWDRLMSECANTAPAFPGTMRLGSRGDGVRQVQQCLNNIANQYPGIGRLTVDSSFGPRTQSAVIAFQQLFGLNPDGVVGPATWAAIMQACNADSVFTGTLRPGSTGEAVRQVQRCLNNISGRHPAIPRLTEDGNYGNQTGHAVRIFQQIFEIEADGLVGPNTWNMIMAQCAVTGRMIESAPHVEEIEAEDVGAIINRPMSSATLLMLMMMIRQ